MDNTPKKTPRIEIRTGSDSDIPKIKEAYQLLEKLGIAYSPRILSAHRTPQIMAAEAQRLHQNGFSVSIAAAGGSAHLPGMTASETLVPVVGLPVKTSTLDGVDSLYSIIQMPNGIPVGSVGIGRAGDAALLAAQIAFLDNSNVRAQIRALRNLPPTNHNEPLFEQKVLIIHPEPKLTDEKALSQMAALLEDMNLAAQWKNAGTDNIAEGLENSSLCAIIAILPMEESPVVSQIFNMVSNTEIPVIALPVLNGKAKSGDPLNLFNELLNQGDKTPHRPHFPVAGMGINRYLNAAIFASQIAGLYFPTILEKLSAYRQQLAETVVAKDKRLKQAGVKDFI
jgi:5-(carboxyamino)imidazole ribonucleotide mutase